MLSHGLAGNSRAGGSGDHAPAAQEESSVASAYRRGRGGGGGGGMRHEVAGEGGLDWGGSRPAPKAVSLCGLCGPTSLAPSLGPHPRLSGLTAAQTAGDPRTSPRRWRQGGTAVPVCVGRARPGPGGGVQGTGSGTVGGEGGGQGMHWKGGGTPAPPLHGAQPMPSHSPPDAKCQPQWHL